MLEEFGITQQTDPGMMLKRKLPKLHYHQVLFTLIFLLGIFARMWEFRVLPPGLNQDEASNGVDAYSLYRFGVDRNGVSYPVHFISWGSGQSALYGYILIPFIAIGGLSPVTVRIPQLIFGVLTIPLVYFIAKRTKDNRFALIAMFFIAISPWHIMLSRWGLESNLLPFVFSLGFACLLKSTTKNSWFILAGVLFALCLYAYGTAYAAVPVMLLCAIPILLQSKRVSIKTTIMGLTAFAIVGFPMFLFLIVNLFKLNSVQFGLMSMPRLPLESRFETLSFVFNDNPIKALVGNLQSMMSLLINQTDGRIWNTLEQYGYFYKYSSPLWIFGIAQLLFSRRSATTPEQSLLLAWLLASFTIGILHPININRINLIFIPLILCASIAMAWVGKRSVIALIISLCVFFISFMLFTNSYHGEEYRRPANRSYFTGLIPALEFAQNVGENNDPICVTNSVNMPYIFVLFTEKINPLDYLNDIVYFEPPGQHRNVLSLGRYFFGVERCPGNPRTIFILEQEEPPNSAMGYKITHFGDYSVYQP